VSRMFEDSELVRVTPFAAEEGLSPVEPHMLLSSDVTLVFLEPEEVVMVLDYYDDRYVRVLGVSGIVWGLETDFFPVSDND
jgi:hypothetical protein